MRGERMPPGLRKARRAEDWVLGPFESFHHKRAGRQVPIEIPALGVVAPVLQQVGLFGRPLHGELIFTAETCDAAEIEYQDGMERMLALGGEQAVVDGGNEGGEEKD